MDKYFGFRDFGFTDWTDIEFLCTGYNPENKNFEYSLYEQGTCYFDVPFISYIIDNEEVKIGRVPKNYRFPEPIELSDVPALKFIGNSSIKIADVDLVKHHEELCHAFYENLYLDMLEKEGFSKKVYFTGGDYPELQGKPFKIISRCLTLDEDLEHGPGWIVDFGGRTEFVYPDEVVPSRMRFAGCPYSDEEYGIKKDEVSVR